MEKKRGRGDLNSRGREPTRFPIWRLTELDYVRLRRRDTGPVYNEAGVGAPVAWLWRVMSPWAVPLIKMRLRTSVEGKEHVPKEGAAILASNHLSALDHIVLPAVTRRVIYNISKKEAFEKPVKAWFFRHWGVIPLDRGAGDTAALDKAKEILRGGNLFCIYPEGTRSPDGRLYKGRTGVARIALEVGVPIVPVAMIGTFEAKPKGQKGIQKGVRTKAVVGQPLDVSQYYGKHEDREVCRKVTDMVMEALQELSGQEYVYEYAPNPVYAAKGKAPASLDEVAAKPAKKTAKKAAKKAAKKTTKKAAKKTAKKTTKKAAKKTAKKTTKKAAKKTTKKAAKKAAKKTTKKTAKKTAKKA